jgi:hypothetical protein
VDNVVLHAPKGLTLDAFALILPKEDVKALRWLRTQWGEPKRIDAINETRYVWDVKSIIHAGWGRTSKPELKSEKARRSSHEHL